MSAFLDRYGLGQIYMKQEKYEAALKHFSLAAHINPNSSVLRCCCGTAFRRMNRLEDALKQLKVTVSVCAHASFTASGAQCFLQIDSGQLLDSKPDLCRFLTFCGC